MGGLRLIPLGVGDAFSERWYSSALALEHEGRILLVDCPHPMRKMLRDASIGTGLQLTSDRIEAVFVTHLHADHASGLESFAYAMHFGLGQRLTLACHPEVARRLWDGHLAAGMEQILPAVGAPFETRKLEDWFDVVSVEETRPVRLGPFTVRCRRTIHHIPTAAVRVQAGGRELGYSADTAFDPSLIEWLAEADLVVHETNHGVHTPYASLAALPANLRSRMRLIHYPDDFDASGSAIAVLEQARVYEV